MRVHHRKSFTLIEMLIVIVIIGILAAALVPRLTSVQGRARDTKRKADLRQIAQALEIYKGDNSKYPLPAGCTYYGTGGGPPKCYQFSYNAGQPYAHYIAGITGVYISSLPTDPRNTVDLVLWQALWTGRYIYYYGNVYESNIHSYDLVALLENKNDPDRCELNSSAYKRRYWWPTVWLCAGSTWHPNLYEQLPYSN